MKFLPSTGSILAAVAAAAADAAVAVAAVVNMGSGPMFRVPNAA
jgi:hypothetical protein